MPPAVDGRRRFAPREPGVRSLAQTRRLPGTIVWAIILCIPVGVGVVNCLIVWSTSYLLTKKFTVTQMIVNENGVAAGALAYMVMCVTFATASACIVAFLSPICAGSGLPEGKGFLNGNRIAGIFRLRALLVRVVGIILALAAGFPIGREGPMVAIGGTIGYGITHFLALPWARHCIEVDASAADRAPALIVDEERFAQAKRMGFILGGAAGISAAFDAPIGGILYMFEEATVTAWPTELTFRAFVCSVCGALVSRALFNLAGQDVHRVLIYTQDRWQVGTWSWSDVPFFVLLAGCMGLLSALFSRVLVLVWAFRARWSSRMIAFQPFAKVVECIMYAALCAALFALAPLVTGCTAEDRFVSDGVVADAVAYGKKNASAQVSKEDRHRLKLVPHNCPLNEVSEAATLLLSSTEGAVKHLYSRARVAPASLLLVLVLYTTLAAGMPGLPVPMGNFLPSMLIGAVAGRLVGEGIGAIEVNVGLVADAGVYSLVGSASMLSGFTHMSIAVVVILVEAAQDLSLVSPLMLGIFISRGVSKAINKLSYDEALMLKKGVPFLEADLPHEMDRHEVVAGDICDALPSAALLPPEAPVRKVQLALQRWEVANFPVVSSGVCIGLTSRARLEAALRARGALLTREMAPGDVLEPDDIAVALGDRYESEGEEDLDVLIEGIGNGGGGRRSPSSKGRVLVVAEAAEVGHSVKEGAVPVHRIMDPSPFTLLEDMPVPRLYPLFTRTSTTVACVVSRRGEFRGLLSRSNLMSASNSALRPPKKSKSSRRGFQALP